MARKTPAKVKEMLERHNTYMFWLLAQGSTWTVGDQTLPMHDKLMQLRGMNRVIEDVLHLNNCYHGFSYKKANGDWYDDADRAARLWDGFDGLYGEIRVYGGR